MTTFTTWDSEETISVTLSGGNLVATATAATGQVRAIDYRTTGKLYFEVAFDASGGNSGTQVGVCGTAADLFNGTFMFAYNGQTGNYAVGNGGPSGTGLGALNSATACFAIDVPNKKGWVRKNGGLWNNDAAANPATGTNGIDLTAIAVDGLQPFCTQSNTGVATANFGSSAFAQTVPSGFAGWDVSGGSCKYSNTGGTGDRTASITSSTTLTINGTFNHIINGNTSETNMFFNGSSVGNIMKFDFGVGVKKIIDMWRFYASNNTAEGTWQVAGSNDDSGYTNLGSANILKGGDTTRTTTYFLANNSTAYRYYRWTLTAGATSSSPWIQELEFRLSDPPSLTGTMTPTEAKDIFAGVGGLVGGSWHSTEAKDIFSAVSAPSGIWASVEAKDVWHGAGYPQLKGLMLATETADIAGMLGTVTAPLALDGHGTGQAGGTNITSASASITTTGADRVIVVNIVTGGFFAQGAPTAVTDTAGLTWKRRSRRSFSPKSSGVLQFNLDTWWAHAPTALTGDTITVTTAATGLIAIETFGVSGANFTTPWDKHTGSGQMRNSEQINIASADAACPVYTAVPRTFTFGVYGSGSAPSATTTAAFTYLESIHGTEATSGTACYVAMAYAAFNTQQVGTNSVDFFVASPPISGFADYSVSVDSIVAAGESGTADGIRWFFDGAGNRNIVALAGSGNSIATNVATFNPNSVMCAAVVIEGAGTLGSPTVNHVSDTNSTSGWTRRSRVTDALGTFVAELWYVQMPLPLPTVTGSVTVVCDNVGAGDILSVVLFAINGPDIFLRGELFDGHVSLPASNHGETAAFQTVGPFSTINLNVLEINIGANQSTDLTGFYELPWLPLLPPAELVSSTPAFNIALQFKFSDGVVANDTAIFDASPRPTHWLMLADALPVGPPTPPQGVWASTEAKDVTRHTLDYTSIGIASPGGWVGLLPIHGTMAAIDAKDKATNSGAFTALFTINGWVGWVPAHATWASTGAKDIASWHAWVLGEPLVGRWRSAELRDRMGASNRPTVTAVMAAQEAGDRHSGTAFLIPKAVPAPARKRNVVIVT